MMFEDNAELHTLLTIAVARGERAVRALQGEVLCEARAEDFDDLDEQETSKGRYEEEFDHDHAELRFLSKRDRSRRRLNLRKVDTRKVVTRQTTQEAVEREQRAYVDDFMEALYRVQQNLRRHSRYLYLDVEAACTRCFETDVLSSEYMEEEEVRVQRLVNFLTELLDQDNLSHKLQDLSSAQTIGFNGYGKSMTELRQDISRWMAADIAAMEAACGDNDSIA